MGYLANALEEQECNRRVRYGRTHWSSLFAVSIIVLAVGAGVWLLRERRRIEPAIRGASAQTAPDNPTSQSAAEAVELPFDQADSNRLNLVATDLPKREEDRSLEPELSAARQQLQGAIEASIYGVLDPASILDSVLALTDSSVDTHSIPETTSGGTLQYPLSDKPEGVEKAQFFIKGASTTVANTHALSLQLQLARPVEPYLLDGFKRTNPETEITLAWDSTGHPIQVSIMTSIPVAPESANAGVPIDQTRVTNGVVYSIKLDNPGHWTARGHGMDHGTAHIWEMPVTLAGATWPQDEGIQLLASRLTVMYDSVKQDYSEDKK